MGSLAKKMGLAVRGTNDFWMDAETSGAVCEEQLVTQHWPIYIALQTLLTIGPYLFYRLVHLQVVAGLESMAPGKTLVVVHSDCVDYRLELWRWFSYQFTHLSLVHVGVNALMLVVTGLPLEGFHGHWRIIAIFNLGAIGGATVHAAVMPHANGLAGMSAGCYALIGMHWGDLGMNWRQSKFRRMKLILLFLLVALDVLSATVLGHAADEPVVVSHSSHIGGFVVGFLMSILLVRNLKVKRIERFLQGLVVLILIGLVSCSGAWLAQWPPRSLFEADGWCWVRQANNRTVFGDLQWHCIRCKDDACIRKWTGQEARLLDVNYAFCTGSGIWE